MKREDAQMVNPTTPYPTTPDTLARCSAAVYLALQDADRTDVDDCRFHIEAALGPYMERNMPDLFDIEKLDPSVSVTTTVGDLRRLVTKAEDAAVAEALEKQQAEFRGFASWLSEGVCRAAHAMSHEGLADDAIERVMEALKPKEQQDAS